MTILRHLKMDQYNLVILCKHQHVEGRDVECSADLTVPVMLFCLRFHSWRNVKIDVINNQSAFSSKNRLTNARAES